MRKNFLLLFFSFLVYAGFAQKELNHQNEIGIHLGGVTYVGDLSPTINPSFIRPAGQIFYRKSFRNNISVLRFNALVGQVTADESKVDLALPQSRQLSFSTTIAELSLIYEYNFFDFRDVVQSVRMSPYLFAGLGVTSTMGEAQNAFAVLPFGIGFKWAFAKQTNLNVEFGTRKVFSDEFDGYDDDEALSSSIPGDWYHFLGVGISYTMYNQECPKGTPGY